jgi:hypothetical protein
MLTIITELWPITVKSYKELNSWYELNIFTNKKRGFIWIKKLNCC